MKKPESRNLVTLSLYRVTKIENNKQPQKYTKKEIFKHKKIRLKTEYI